MSKRALAKLLLKSFRINGSCAWVSSASCWAISGGRYLQPSWKLLSRLQDRGRLKHVSTNASTTSSVRSHLSPCCNSTCNTQDSMDPPYFIQASLCTVNHHSKHPWSPQVVVLGIQNLIQLFNVFQMYIDCSARSIKPVVAYKVGLHHDLNIHPIRIQL